MKMIHRFFDSEPVVLEPRTKFLNNVFKKHFVILSEDTFTHRTDRVYMLSPLLEVRITKVPSFPCRDKSKLWSKLCQPTLSDTRGGVRGKKGRDDRRRTKKIP